MEATTDTGLTWRKARASAQNGSCVEVASDSTATYVRDTKNRSAGHITVTSNAFGELVARIKRGELDL